MRKNHVRNQVSSNQFSCGCSMIETVFVVEVFEITYSDQEVKSVVELSDKEIKQVPSELLHDENPDEIHIPDD